MAMLGCEDGTEVESERMNSESLMTDEAFWGLIEEAKNPDFGRDSRPARLKELLEKRGPYEIAAFDAKYHDALGRAYRWDLWGAAYIIGGGCSDDGFRYFCDFLISEGREVFERALVDPDSLAELDDVGEAELEAYGYAAGEAFEALSGKKLPPTGSGLPTDPVGSDWEEEDLGRLFPRLAKKYDWDT